jgi:hypothetical protein
VPDDYYEVGLCIINSQGIESPIKWEPVVDHTINITKPTVSAVTGTGFTVSWLAIAGASNYEYQIDNGPWIATTALTLVLTELTAGKVYSVGVRAVIGVSRGKTSKVWGFTTPGNADPVFYVERIQARMLGGTYQSGINRLVIGNALKTSGLSYTLTQGFVLDTALVGGTSTFITVIQDLTDKLDVLASHDHVSYSVVEFADYAGSGSSSVPELSFVIS